MTSPFYKRDLKFESLHSRISGRRQRSIRSANSQGLPEGSSIQLCNLLPFIIYFFFFPTMLEKFLLRYSDPLKQYPLNGQMLCSYFLVISHVQGGDRSLCHCFFLLCLVGLTTPYPKVSSINLVTINTTSIYYIFHFPDELPAIALLTCRRT